MNLVRSVAVVPGVYQLRVIGARVTALFGDRRVVLVDAGPRASLGLIAAGLWALGSSLDQVRLVVLTHHHPDHSGGLAKLVEATSAQVAIHRREAGIVNGNEPLRAPLRNPVLAAIGQPFLPLLYGHPVTVHYALDDGDTLPMAQEVQVVHTPGHTPGSICLYVVSKKVLIVGDALQYRFGRLSLPASTVTQDPQQARESLKKLLPLDFDVICFSHFPPLRRDARGALQRLVENTAS